MKTMSRDFAVAALAVCVVAACTSSSTGDLADSRVNAIDAATATADAHVATLDAAITIDAPASQVDAAVASDAARALPDATIVLPDANLPAVCGDGIVEAGEQCDDGNSNDYDACSNACVAAGAFMLASISSAGVQGDNATDSQLVNQFRTMNTDGSVVVFFSSADNLIDNYTTSTTNVFAHDFTANTTVLVSVDSNGVEGNDVSANASISADGTLVVFESAATNLIDNDTNGQNDIFVHDLTTGVTELVSAGLDGAPSNGYSYSALISADGRFVVFSSSGTNLVENVTSNAGDIFIRDRQLGVTTVASLANDGSAANGSSNDPYMTPDGRFVAFWSYAENLVSTDDNGQADIFVRDTQMHTTTIASLHTDGTASNAGSYSPTLSDDGSLVVYSSDADNLVDNDDNNNRDVFIHDLVHHTTALVSVTSSGVQSNGGSIYPVISPAGDFVAFVSEASNLDPVIANGNFGLFLRNLADSTTAGLSVNASGVGGDGGAYSASFDSNEDFVTFYSSAENLVIDDDNGVADFFRTSLITQ